MASSGGDRQVRIVVSADVANAIRGLTEVSNAAGRVGGSAEAAQTSTSKWLDALKTGLSVVGVQTGFNAIKQGFQFVIDQGMSYERSMNTLGAVTGANTTQMQALGDKAKQLGNDITIPGASAGDAAAAMAELAKGGLNVSQTMQAAAGTLHLAAAAQVDGAQAAQIQANALNAFGLQANQADHVADLLANSANAASGEVTDMAAALQQSATVAHGFGISVDDSAVTLALFAKNGVLGSDAGTSFKTMLTSLASPTAAQSAALAELGVKIYDAQGKFVGMEAITQQLALAHQNLTTAQYNEAASTAFGTDAIRAANILGAEGITGWNKMATAVEKAGGAQDLAAAQSQGLVGALDRLENSAATTALTLYEKMSPALSAIADFGAVAFGWLGDAINWISQLPAPVLAGAAALGAMILLRGPLNALFLQAIAGYTRMALAVQGATFSFAGVATAARAALAAVGGPIGLAIVGVTTALTFFATKTDDAATSQQDFAGALDQTTGKLNDQAAATISSKVASSGLGDQYKALGGNVADLVDAIGGIPSAQATVKKTFDDAAAAAQGAGGAFTNAGAAIAAGGGQMTLSNDQLAASTEALTGKLATIQGTSNLYTQLLGDMSGAQNQAAVNAQGLTGQLGSQGSAMEKATQKSTPFADALKDVRDAASEADANAQFLSITLLELSGNQVPAEQRARANAAAFREVGQATRDLGDANDSVSDKQKKLDDLTAHLGTTLDGQAVSATNAAITQQDVDAAARDLATAQANVADATDKQKDALDKAAQSARDMTAEAYNNSVGQVGMQGAIQNAVAVMQSQREQFIQSAVDAGISRQAAEQLADAQGLIPDRVRTTYEQTGAETATQKAAELNAALDKINNRTVHYTVVGGEVTTEGTMRATSSGLAVYSDGGLFRGAGTGRSDSNVIRVSDGEFIMNAVSTARNLPLLHAMNNTPGFADGGLVSARVVGDYAAKDWTGALSDAFNSYAQKLKPVMSLVGNINYTPSAGVAQWVATVLQALAITGQPASYSAYVLHQMQTESGGNPNAINNWDINAQRGDPSRGLMQTIMSTFNAYRLPGLSANIYDPLSNIVASIRYVLARYGSIPAGMRGVAYDTGGVWPTGTAGWNTSGGPEYVLKPWQWAAAQSAIQHVTNNAGATYQGGQHGGIHIENLNASQPGQATAELDYVLARCR